MATSQDRHRLHRRLEELMGEDEASTLMDHLPPVGWADVATKADLDHLHVLTSIRFDTMATKADLADFRTEMHKVVRTHTLFLVGTNLTFMGVLATLLTR